MPLDTPIGLLTHIDMLLERVALGVVIMAIWMAFTAVVIVALGAITIARLNQPPALTPAPAPTPIWKTKTPYHPRKS